MPEPIYTLSQIKAAFWDNFHEAGEIYLRDSGTPEQNTQVTEQWWLLFSRSLRLKTATPEVQHG